MSFPWSPVRRALLTSLVLAATALLGACGSDDGDSRVRLINATVGVGSLDVYTDDDDDPRSAGVSPDAQAAYFGLSDGSYEFKIKRNGSETTLLSKTTSVSKDKSYSLVAWGREDAIKLTPLSEDEDEPSSGNAKVRVFNAGVDAGNVDVYVTDAATDLGDTSANVVSLASGAASGYFDLSQGDYRLRVTGTGSKTDVRLDLSSFTLADRDRLTVILQSTPSGVLVNVLVSAYQDTLTPRRNTQARARLVASVAGNGVATASVGSTSLGNALTSPGVGSYVLVPAGSQTLRIQVNGATLSAESTSFTAGADYTLLVYGDGALAQSTLQVDDNRLPTTSGKAKMRLVNGANGYYSLSLSLDSVSVANEVQLGTLSDYELVTSNLGNALIEVTSALSNDPIYTTEKSSGDTGVDIVAGAVYTMFELSGNDTPRGILRKERPN